MSGLAVYRATYCTRYDVMSSPDIEQTTDYVRHVDSAIEAASDDIDGLTHRRFWNNIQTSYWDWPNNQAIAAWRIWFDERELADVTVNVPVVTSGGNVIPAGTIFWGPWNYAPPYTFLELDRSSSASFGQGSTPQRDIAITGTFGYWTKTRAAGSLAASATSSSATITVTDSSAVNVGDVLTIGTENLLVSDNAMADTGQQQESTGCTSASAADNVLEVADGTQIHAGEVVALDAEWMLAQSVTGNLITVDRAWGGTALTEHSNAEVYALRSLTVQRGFGGTVAASHNSGAAALAAVVPGEVRELAIAEALNYVFQKTSGYARTLGEAGSTTVPGGGLPDLRNRVWTRYGRKNRIRVV